MVQKKWSKIAKNGHKLSKTVNSGQKWSTTKVNRVESNQKWSKTVKNGENGQKKVKHNK